MGSTIQSIQSPLCPPEVRITCTPQGNPVQIATTAGVFQWPDLYQGTSAYPNGNVPGFITPYSGNVASGTHTGYTFRTHPINTPLTFSGVVSAPAGIAVTAMAWNFGDGTTSTLPTPTHSYKQLVPSMIASLEIEYSNGEFTLTPLQLNLTAS